MAENTDVTLGGASGAAATEPSNQEGQGKETEPKTYTEKEFAAEVDRRVTEAVKTAQASGYGTISVFKIMQYGCKTICKL